MREEFEEVVKQLVEASRLESKPIGKRFDISGIDGVSVCFNAAAKQDRVKLTITVEIEQASQYTENMIGYPETLDGFESDELSVVGNSVLDSVREALGTNADTPLIYSSDHSTPTVIARYRSIFDLWFTDDGEIDSVWIRAQPQRDE